MKKRKLLWTGLLLAALYLLMIFLLVAAESAAADANITDLPSAFWYSLTTLTTVGYGDTYPVTEAGRIIGVVFQLLSVGMLAFLIGAAVEIRLDECDFDTDEIRDIFSCQRKAELIATCHVSLPSQVAEAAEKLSAAILAGADYVDIPLDFPENSKQWLLNLALNHGTRIILSWHNYTNTEPLPRLREIAAQALREGADIVKIVTTATRPEDAATVLALYDGFEPGRLLAFAMGPLGRDSRFQALEKGAPFLFVAPTRDGTTASGQPCVADLLPESAFKLRGEAALPASKSYAQRAILLAALANGTTKLYGVTLCDDIVSAIGVAQSLYADVSLDGTILTIEGHQDILHDGLRVRPSRRAAQTGPPAHFYGPEPPARHRPGPAQSRCGGSGR